MKTVYDEMKFETSSDNSFTSDSDNETETKSNKIYKIIQPIKITPNTDRDEIPLKPKSKENTQSHEKLPKKKKRKIF